jgi:hypothetical protein
MEIMIRKDNINKMKFSWVLSGGGLALLACFLPLLAGCSDMGSSSFTTTGTAPSPNPPQESPPAPNPPATVPNPADLVFFDDFEYVVGRDDTNAATIFQQQGRWSWAKTEQSPHSNVTNGYLYTVNQIPGYSGAFPGGSSSRALAIEARPASLGFQTDFYLQFGDGADANAVPGDVWFQFWVYINNYGSQRSLLNRRNKLLYPCKSSYPCNQLTWMIQQGGDSLLPHRQSLGDPSSNGSFIQNWLNASLATITASPAQSWEAFQLGHTSTAEYMAANRWTLVKIHIDTSTQSGRYETWMRPQGGNWTKVAEWIDGVTPGFTWRINPGAVGGHRFLRMPTTIPGGATDPVYDSWVYMDDFAIARSEAGLPVYD